MIGILQITINQNKNNKYNSKFLIKFNKITIGIFQIIHKQYKNNKFPNKFNNNNNKNLKIKKLI